MGIEQNLDFPCMPEHARSKADASRATGGPKVNEGLPVSEDDSGGAWAELEKLAKAEYGHTVEELFAVEEPVASEIEYAAPEVWIRPMPSGALAAS